MPRLQAAPGNGLLIGVASGAGFPALETMGYAFVTLVQSDGNLRAVDGVLLLRGLLSPTAHMTWTGLTCAALWQAARQRWHPRALLRLAAVFLIAVGLHASWDASTTLSQYTVIAAISLLLLITTAHRMTETRHQTGRGGNRRPRQLAHR